MSVSILKVLGSNISEAPEIYESLIEELGTKVAISLQQKIQIHPKESVFLKIVWK